MRETRAARDFQKTVRFEPEVVLALNASYSWKLEMLADLTHRHTLSVPYLQGFYLRGELRTSERGAIKLSG